MENKTRLERIDYLQRSATYGNPFCSACGALERELLFALRELEQNEQLKQLLALTETRLKIALMALDRNRE